MKTVTHKDAVSYGYMARWATSAFTVVGNLVEPTLSWPKLRVATLAVSIIAVWMAWAVPAVALPPVWESDFGQSLNLGDDSTTIVSFGFAFPFQGGSFSSAEVSSNGFLSLGGFNGDDCCNATIAEFLNGVARISPAWYDLDPRGTPNVKFKAFPGRAVFTWDSVPEYSNTADNTFQVQLFSNGTIVFGYAALNPDAEGGFRHDAIVGITPGGGVADPGEVDYSSTPFFSSASCTVYEFFSRSSGTTGGDTFDLSDTNIVFYPNASEGCTVANFLLGFQSTNPQFFTVGDPATSAASITITDFTGGRILATNDLRIHIPAGLDMTWDTSVTTVSLSGNGASKVSSAISYDGTNRILFLDVLSDFASGDQLTITGLQFTNFSTSSQGVLGLEIGNDGQIVATDVNFIAISNGVLDTGASTLTAAPTNVPFEGGSRITVTPRDSSGVPLGPGSVVSLSNTGAGVLGSVVDVGDGTYTTTLTAPSVAGSDTVSAVVDGQSLNATAALTYSCGDLVNLNQWDGTAQLYDPHSTGGGDLIDGTDDSYDHFYKLYVNSIRYYGQPICREGGGREILFQTETIAGLEVSRKLYVSPTDNFARYLEILHNPGDSPITVNVTIEGDLGSDEETIVVTSSDGDTIFETTDTYFISDDEDDGGDDPSLGHVFGNIDIATIEDGDEPTYGWLSVVVPPGETVIFMHFPIQSAYRTIAATQAQALLPLPPESLVGVSVTEVNQIQNFDVDQFHSATHQFFTVNDPSTPAAPITITDFVGGSILAANDLRIHIPAGLSMTWDTSVTTVALSGSGASKVSSTVSYDGTSKILFLDVLTDFTSGDKLTITGLQFTNFSAPSQGTLGLEVGNNGQIAHTDTNFIAISTGVLDTGVSTLTAAPTNVPFEGESRITVTPTDSSGIPLGPGRLVNLANTGAGALGSVLDVGDGTYVAVLTPPSAPGSDTVSGVVDGQSLNASATLTYSCGDLVNLDQQDGIGQLYDPHASSGGDLIDGTDDSYDHFYKLYVNGTRYLGQAICREAEGREIRFQAESIAGLEVSRKLYVSPTDNFARYLEILHNPGASPVTVNVTIEGDLGSDEDTTVVTSSDGDNLLEPTDTYFISDDNDDGYYDPSLGHVFGNIDIVSLDYYDEPVYGWLNVVVPPGETVIFMHFPIQSFNNATATAHAQALLALPPESLIGISLTERSQIQNFDVTAVADSVGMSVAGPSNPTSVTTADFRLVTFPAIPSNPDPTDPANLPAGFTAYDPSRYRLFRFHPLVGAILEADDPGFVNSGDPTLDNGLAPGHGYWLVCATSLTFSIPGTPVTDSEFSIPLYRGTSGFNLIGNPFLAPVSTSDLRISHNGGTTVTFLSADSINPVLFTFLPETGEYVSSTTMEPYKGYFLNRTSSIPAADSVELIVPNPNVFAKRTVLSGPANRTQQTIRQPGRVAPLPPPLIAPAEDLRIITRLQSNEVVSLRNLRATIDVLNRGEIARGNVLVQLTDGTGRSYYYDDTTWVTGSSFPQTSVEIPADHGLMGIVLDGSGLPTTGGEGTFTLDVAFLDAFTQEILAADSVVGSVSRTPGVQFGAILTLVDEVLGGVTENIDSLLARLRSFLSEQ